MQVPRDRNPVAEEPEFKLFVTSDRITEMPSCQTPNMWMRLAMGRDEGEPFPRLVEKLHATICKRVHASRICRIDCGDRSVRFWRWDVAVSSVEQVFGA